MVSSPPPPRFTVAGVSPKGTGVVSIVRNGQSSPLDQQQLHTALEFAADAIFITRLEDHRILYANRRAAKMLGYAPESLAGTAFSALFPRNEAKYGQGLLRILNGQGQLRAELEVQRQEGPPLLTEINACLLPDDNCYIALCDITERKRSELLMRHQANHDYLTGLPNRALFLDRIDHQLAYAQRQSSRFAVLFIDLDNFKAINNGFGHSTGDEVLKEVARLLQSCMRKSDTVARLGGDEFCAIIHDLVVPADAASVASKVQNRLARTIQFQTHAFQVNASIGIALYPIHGADAATLINAADRAMYQIRRSKSGSGNFAFATT